MISNTLLVSLMPWLCIFLPSTAIAKLEVYVISLHRLPIVEESFVVRTLGEASSLLELARLTPTASLVYISLSGMRNSL